MSHNGNLLGRNIPTGSAKQSNRGYNGEEESHQPSGAPVGRFSVVRYTERGCHEKTSLDIISLAVGLQQMLVSHKHPGHELSRWRAAHDEEPIYALKETDFFAARHSEPRTALEHSLAL